MHDVVAGGAKRYQVPYWVDLVRLPDGRQRCDMMNMDEVSPYHAVLVFIV
jgi:hypothetical protein